MATSQMSEVIQHLRGAVLPRDGADLTDGQLLGQYICRPDEAALTVLVRRHAPMVWGVCARVLRNHHDAEDAFQATFLVLVRKATSILPRDMVANWLYGVAHQTALKARATAAKRRTREKQTPDMPEPAVTDRDLWNDLQPLLDRELSRLPDKYRVAILLCELEGKTRKEAARQLGVPEGTLAARVARGRAMLAKRLARHGLAVSAGSLAAVLTQNAAAAPPALVAETIQAAGLFAAGQATAGAIPATVAALTEGVLKAMLVTKLKIVAIVVLLAALVCSGAGLFFNRLAAATQAEPRRQAPEQGKTEPAKNSAERKDLEDLKRLEGAWDIVAAEFNGEESTDHFKRTLGGLLVKDKACRWKFSPAKQEDVKLALDADKSPRHVDMDVGAGLVLPGIYELSGDTLRLCWDDSGTARPTTFRTKADDRCILIRLRRAQEDKIKMPAKDQPIADLIAGLGADRFEVREKASRALIEIGRPALPELQKAAQNGEPEIKARARKVIKAIEARPANR